MSATFERIPCLVVFDEVSAFKDTYGSAIFSQPIAGANLDCFGQAPLVQQLAELVMDLIAGQP